MHTNEIIFFSLILVVMFSTAKGAVVLGPKMNLSSTITLLFSSVIGTAFLFLIYKLSKLNKCDCGENFHFQVSPAKLCQGYPYMQSSASPEIQEFCHKLMSTKEGQHEYAQMNCNNGFHGRPVHWQYTPGSNDKWENEMCDKPLNLNDPCPL